MKKIALISALALSGLIYNTANAQIHLGLRLGIHLPGATIAVQAPVYQETNYVDNGEDYYYLPDIDAYYSVPENCYYYNDGYNWVSAAYLPGEYCNYDWRNARRYEVRAHRPFMNNDFYRSRFRGNVGNWGHYNDRPDRSYANRDFRDDHRDDAPRFERRGEMNRGGEHADNRGWGNGNRGDNGWNRGGRDDHFDNRGQGGNYNQPNRDNQNQGNQNQRNNDNRNQGGNYNQPQQQDRGQGQPTHQNGGNNGGGNQRDNSGNQSHFTDNRGQQWGHDRMRS